MLKGISCWLAAAADYFGSKGFAVEVQVNVDAIFGCIQSIKP